MNVKSLYSFTLLVGLWITTPLSFAGHFDKILIVIFENTSYSEIMHSPTFAKLANCASSPSTTMECEPFNANYGYALIRPYYNNHSGGETPTRPSQPSYIAMTSGSIQNIHDDLNQDLNVDNIAMQLEKAKLSWKTYAEDLPSSCFTGRRAGLYVRKHVPFLSYTNVRQKSCDRIVNAQELKDDLSKNNLANVSFYIPNILNDGHNSTPDEVGETATRLHNANHFLSRMMGTDPSTGNYKHSAEGTIPEDALFQKFMAQGGLLVITFDEPNLRKPVDKSIYTLLAGNMIKTGQYSPLCYSSPQDATVSMGSTCATGPSTSTEGPYLPNQCNHYNLLRMIETNFNLPCLDSKDTSYGYKSALPLDKGICLWNPIGVS